MSADSLRPRRPTARTRSAGSTLRKVTQYKMDKCIMAEGGLSSRRRYYTEPSGTYWQCNAKAIGSGSKGADSSLQEQYKKSAEPEQAN